MISISKLLSKALVLVCIASIITSAVRPAFATDNEKFADIYNSNESILVGNMADIPISDTNTLRVCVKTDGDTTKVTDKTSSLNASSGIFVSDILECSKEIKEERKVKAAIAAKSYSSTTYQGGLIDIKNPDKNYGKKVVIVEGRDREILENLVFGEAGNQGFIGCALVAQAIKDMYILGNYSSVDAVRRNTGYSGSITKGTNQDAKNAVAYVFDQGGYAVQHRILYFYAPQYARGSFHETQNFIVQYGGHKFFDRWK